MIERHDGIIVQKVTYLLIPFIQVFALYVLAHGHYSPGGGFQAGVLIGASIILELLVGTKTEVKHFSVEREFLFATLGVGAFVAIGASAIFFGSQLFDYGSIAFLGHLEPYRRYLGILIAEIGVTAAVAMTFIVIFHVLAFLPERES